MSLLDPWLLNLKPSRKTCYISTTTFENPRLTRSCQSPEFDAKELQKIFAKSSIDTTLQKLEAENRCICFIKSVAPNYFMLIGLGSIVAALHLLQYIYIRLSRIIS